MSKPAQHGIELAEHIVAMAGDTYLEGHPEWQEIVSEARLLLAEQTLAADAHARLQRDNQEFIQTLLDIARPADLRDFPNPYDGEN
jgi:hypothetical protein